MNDREIHAAKVSAIIDDILKPTLDIKSYLLAFAYTNLKPFLAIARKLQREIAEGELLHFQRWVHQGLYCESSRNTSCNWDKKYGRLNCTPEEPCLHCQYYDSSYRLEDLICIYDVLGWLEDHSIQIDAKYRRKHQEK